MVCIYSFFAPDYAGSIINVIDLLKCSEGEVCKMNCEDLF